MYPVSDDSRTMIFLRTEAGWGPDDILETGALPEQYCKSKFGFDTRVLAKVVLQALWAISQSYHKASP